MSEEQKQRYLEIKETLAQLKDSLDSLHKEEASILAEIDALEREMRERGCHDIEHQLLSAFTRLVAAGSALAQVALNLQVPPTIFEPVLKPHEQPAQKKDEAA